jgi:hypothetical protein
VRRFQGFHVLILLSISRDYHRERPPLPFSLSDPRRSKVGARIVLDPSEILLIQWGLPLLPPFQAFKRNESSKRYHPKLRTIL